MKRFLPFSLTVFTAFCVMIATERRAWGYVDPGTGFLALQTGASVMAAAGYFLRKRISTLFSGSKTEEKAPAVLPASIREGETRNAA